MEVCREGLFAVYGGLGCGYWLYMEGSVGLMAVYGGVRVGLMAVYGGWGYWM